MRLGEYTPSWGQALNGEQMDNASVGGRSVATSRAHAAHGVQSNRLNTGHGCSMIQPASGK